MTEFERLKGFGGKRVFQLVPRMTDEAVEEIIRQVVVSRRREEKECCICGEEIPFTERKICACCKKEAAPTADKEALEGKVKL